MLQDSFNLVLGLVIVVCIGLEWFLIDCAVFIGARELILVTIDVTAEEGHMEDRVEATVWRKVELVVEGARAIDYFVRAEKGAMQLVALGVSLFLEMSSIKVDEVADLEGDVSLGGIVLCGL